MNKQNDVRIIDEQDVATFVAHRKASQSVLAFFIASVFILGWGLIAMFVLVYSFLNGKEAPNWAVSLESATVTATIAMIFKDHLPSIDVPPRRPK